MVMTGNMSGNIKENFPHWREMNPSGWEEMQELMKSNENGKDVGKSNAKTNHIIIMFMRFDIYKIKIYSINEI